MHTCAFFIWYDQKVSIKRKFSHTSHWFGYFCLSCEVDNLPVIFLIVYLIPPPGCHVFFSYRVNRQIKTYINNKFDIRKLLKKFICPHWRIAICQSRIIKELHTETSNHQPNRRNNLLGINFSFAKLATYIKTICYTIKNKTY